MSPLLALVMQALRELPAPQRGVLVAVSGGLDSVVLFHLARDAADTLGVPLALGHVHHHLRPDAEEDARLCMRLAHAHGVPYMILDVRLDPRLGVQAQARTMRYSALTQAATRLGLGAVLTAHHLDDAVETLLWRLTRGASAVGLAGPRALAPMPTAPEALELWVSRPLLSARRAQLEALALERGWAWREDSSNASDAYTRNHLRHHAMPALREVGGESLSGAAQTLKHLRQRADQVSALARSLGDVGRLKPPHMGARALSARALRGADEAALALLWQRERQALGVGESWGSAQVEALGALLEAGEGELTLPGARASLREGALTLTRQLTRELALIGPEVAHPLTLPWRAGDGAVRWFEHELGWCHDAPAPEGADASLVVQLEERATLQVCGADSARERWAREALRAARVCKTQRWRWPCVMAGEAAEAQTVWVAGARARAIYRDEGARALTLWWRGPRPGGK